MIETILKELEKNSKGFNFLLEKFDISEDELMKTINDLIHDKKIFLNSNNKYEIVSDNFIIAELRKGLNGRGLITNNNMTITIESYDTHNALFGDIVIVKPYSLNKGTVLGIVKRRTNKIVCEVGIKQDKLILSPVIKDTEFSICIPKKFFNALNLIVGDRVCIDLDNKVSDDNTIYINDITKISKIGHYTDKYSDEVAIAINRGFNIDFSEEAMYEVSMIPKEVTEEETTTEATKPKATKKTTSQKSNSTSGVNANFKATMDSYEEFFNDYVDVMKKYKNSTDITSIASDYADYMTKYSDMMQKLNDIKSENLSTADLTYYNEVNARITKKLAEVAN